MMRITLLLPIAAMVLVIVSGCPSMSPGSGDSGGANDNTGVGEVPGSGDDGSAGDSNANVNTNDNSSPAEGGNPSANQNASGNDNGSDDSGDLPTSFRLDGVWEDNGRDVIIEQNGTQVVGNYFSEYFCDLESGGLPVGEQPAPEAMVDSTFLDFRGMLNHGEDVLPGDVITGETTTCRYGYESGNGFVLADMTLTVVDENTLAGQWFSGDGDGDGEADFVGNLTITRQQ